MTNFQLVDDVIDSILSADQRMKFDYSMNRICMFYRDFEDYRKTLSIETIRGCAVIFESSTHFSEPIIPSHSKFVDTSKMFKFRDSEQIYCSLSSEVQRRFMKSPPIDSTRAMYVYMRLLQKVGFVGDYFVPEFSKMQGLTESERHTEFVETISDFVQWVKANSTELDAIHDMDFSEPTSDFRKTLYIPEKSMLPFSILRTETLVLLRVVYGEKQYLEVTDTIFDYLPDIEPEHIIDIFENWEQWRDYPHEWIQGILSLPEHPARSAVMLA